MLADHRTIWPGPRAARPSLGSELATAGFRVLVPDLRGRGMSGPTPAEGGRWTYDDLVDDTAALVGLAGRLGEGLPVALLGHSLFAHTSLAWLGIHPEAPVTRVVALGMALWSPAWEPRPHRWLVRRLIGEASDLVADLAGYLPGRATRAGSADESRDYWTDVVGMMRHGRWSGRRGIDYHQGLRAIRCPVLHVVSDGDRWMGAPELGLAFSAALPHREVLRLGPGCSDPALRGLAPGHMGLCTDPRSAPLWKAIGGWLGG
jgi:predicted alpha/beta hydrolase